jgi:hypothetical protein
MLLVCVHGNLRSVLRYKLLTLPALAEYQYSMASHANCPDEYQYFPIFISLLKKSIGGTGFRFVTLHSFMLVVPVTLFMFQQGVQVGMLDHLKWTDVQ